MRTGELIDAAGAQERQMRKLAEAWAALAEVVPPRARVALLRVGLPEQEAEGRAAEFRRSMREASEALLTAASAVAAVRCDAELLHEDALTRRRVRSI